MVSIRTKFDEFSIKRGDKRDIVERKERTQEYLRQLKMEEIIERMQKLEEIR